MIPGLFGGLSTFRALSTTYLSYVTKESDRSFRFILAEAVAVLANSFSGFLSGYLVEHLSFLMPQIVSVCFILLAVFFSLLLDNAIPTNKRQVVTYENFKSSINCITDHVSINKTVFVLIVLAQFFYSFGEYILYMKN